MVVSYIKQHQGTAIYETMPDLVFERRHMSYFAQTNTSGALAQTANFFFSGEKQLLFGSIFVVVQSLSHVVFVTTLTVAHRFLGPPPSLGVCSSSCPMSQCYYLTILSSVSPFSFCFQSFLASGSFLMIRLFTSGGQSIGVSALATVLLMNKP